MYQVCYTRYHVSFYLWLIGSVLRHCKVPKYYDQDCRFCTGKKTRKCVVFCVEISKTVREKETKSKLKLRLRAVNLLLVIIC